MRVSLNKAGFYLHQGWLRKEAHEWTDIRGVAVIWQSQQNYQHLVLILTFQDRTERLISELSAGFDAFEARLSQQLHGFPKNWRLQFEDAPKEVRHPLWYR